MWNVFFFFAPASPSKFVHRRNVPSFVYCEEQLWHLFSFCCVIIYNCESLVWSVKPEISVTDRKTKRVFSDFFFLIDIIQMTSKAGHVIKGRGFISSLEPLHTYHTSLLSTISKYVRKQTNRQTNNPPTTTDNKQTPL